MNSKSDSQIENGEMLVLSAAVLCCLNTGFVFLNYLFNSEVGLHLPSVENLPEFYGRRKFISSEGGFQNRTIVKSGQMKTDMSVTNIQYCRLFIFA